MLFVAAVLGTGGGIAFVSHDPEIRRMHPHPAGGADGMHNGLATGLRL